MVYRVQDLEQLDQSISPCRQLRLLLCLSADPWGGESFPRALLPEMPLGEVLSFVWSWCLFSTQPNTLVACSWLSPHPQAWPSLLQLLQNPDSKPPLPLALCSPSCSSINCVKTLFIFTKTLFIFTKCPLFSDALQKQHIVFLSVIPGFVYHPSSPCS